MTSHALPLNSRPSKLSPGPTRLIRWLATAALFSAICLRLPAEVASPISGFSTLSINGHQNRAPYALTFLGLGLTRPPVWHGRIEGLSAGVISDSHARWSDGEFEGANGPHYLEITSGAYAGLTTDIVRTDSAARSLTLSLDLSPVLAGGESYRIRPHWTLATLFGPANECGLGGGSVVTADQILILNAETGAYTTYYYKTVGLGGTGWRSSASPFVDQSHAPLCLGQGLLIRRQQPSDLSVRVYGAVKSGRSLLQISPGPNILANVLPFDLPLASSGLYTGDAASGLAGGSVSTADKLLLFDGEGYQTFYYKTVGLGGTGWRSAANAFADASSAIIPAGTSIIIERANNRPRFFWSLSDSF